MLWCGGDAKDEKPMSEDVRFSSSLPVPLPDTILHAVRSLNPTVNPPLMLMLMLMLLPMSAAAAADADAAADVHCCC
jgi:hypothetical protein